MRTEQIVDLVIAGDLCPLPGTALWNEGTLRRPNYVALDMSAPGEEPPIVKEFNRRNDAFTSKMETFRNARWDFYSTPTTRFPGVVGR